MMIIHWFRRDLRLHDNTALAAAVRDCGGHIVPVFIQSEWKRAHRWTGAPRQESLCGAVAALAAGLANAGSRLIVRRGETLAELERLLVESGAEALYYNRDPDPFGRAMEARVAAMAQRLGVRAVGFHDVTVHDPSEVLTTTGTPFRIFTPYAKAWLRTPAAEPRLSASSRFHLPPPGLKSLPLPTLADWGIASTATILEPGEPAARRRMEAFFSGPILEYAALRDLPAAAQTSRFSADLRWGTLSARELVQRCRLAAGESRTVAHRQSVRTFLNELIWREFYMAVLWHWPEVLEHEFLPQFRGLPWLPPGDAFRRWCEGMTGFPIVDAGMRQLAATGFMHNRVRMIVAMFLTKDLHLDWRLGEQFFMQSLADGEIASNNGGWQWSAGTGADAAPYFRIQNPWTQTRRFDPEGEFIKQWVPELRALPSAAFMKPPNPGMRLASGYPPPMVDHARERAATLAMFKDSSLRFEQISHGSIDSSR